MTKKLKKEILNLLEKNSRFIQKDRYNGQDFKLHRFLKKHNYLCALKKELGENFSAKELYYFLSNNNYICDKCLEELDFINFREGYKIPCLNCLNKIETKEEIYNFLYDNWPRFEVIIRLKNKKHPIYKKINYDYENLEDLYVYLTGNTPIKCKLESCENLIGFGTFKLGYKHRQFCCLSCNNKWLSESRKGEGNPVHRMSDENKKKMAEKISIKMKENIKSGKWTPNVTNSWAHSRYTVFKKTENGIIEQKVRSSWEAFFQVLNNSLEYEKLRIPYVYNNSWHNYIVDFIDVKNKKVYELKPLALETKKINIIKADALKKWCKDNGYKYIKISENYFKNIEYDEQLFKTYIKEYDKIKKFKKYFKNEN